MEYQINKEQIKVLAEYITFLISNPDLYEKIVESNEINMEYIKMVNIFGEKKNYFLSENGWKYTVGALKVANSYTQNNINFSEVFSLQGYSDEFWYELLEHLDNVFFSKEKVGSLEEMPCIKIDINSLQIYFELNSIKFSIPDIFSNHMICHYNNGKIRIYFNKLSDFKDIYYGTKSEEGSCEWEVEGIDMNNLPIYFSKKTYEMIPKTDLVTGSYFCIDDKNKSSQIEIDSEIGYFTLSGVDYVVFNKYLDEAYIQTISTSNDITNRDIDDIEFKNVNLEKAWEFYNDLDYYNAINYLGLVYDLEDNNMKFLKLALKLCIYLKTVRLITLREELLVIEKLNYFDKNMYNLFSSYCSLIIEDNIKDTKISNHFIETLPFIKSDKILFKNLVDIINNHGDLNYLLKYKDSESYIEVLILYKLFKNEDYNPYKKKLEGKNIELPSSQELKELVNEI